MKKIVLSALALAAAAGAANAQAIQYQIVERFNDTVVDVADAAPTGAPGTAGNAADKTLWFVVLARATGLNAPTPETLTGIGGFAGAINMTSNVAGGQNGGSYKAAGIGGTGGNPTNNSPANFYPAGTSNPGLGSGAALYYPFRVVADLGTGGNGTRLTANSPNLVDIAGAAGGAAGSAVTQITDGLVPNTAWGVNTWVPVYTFQYDVTDFTARTITFSTNFVGSTYFTSADSSGVPNAIVFGQESQGSYTVQITPAPGAAALLGLGGLVAARRRRA